MLFLATNLAIVLVFSLSICLLDVEPYLNERGLNFNALLVFAAVISFGASQGLGIRRLFMTHPPLAERIATLRLPESLYQVKGA